MARRPVPPSPTVDFPETLEVVSLVDLKPHSQNYRIHPPEELDHIAASLQRHGLYKNVVIAEDGTLLAGHGVVEAAATRLGWHTIAVKRLPYPPDHPEALKVLVGDNEQAALSQVHDGKMAHLVAEMRTWDPVDLLGTGWDAARLDALAQQVAGPTMPQMDPVEVEEVEPDIDRAEVLRDQYQVEVGQIWDVGEHRLCCGDCRDLTVVQQFLRGVTPAMIFADPPYGVSIVATNVPVGGGEAYDIPFGGVKARGSIGGTNPRGSKNNLRIAPDLKPAKYIPVVGDDSMETAIQVVTSLLRLYPDTVQVWWGGNYYADHLPASSCWLVWDKETTGNFADCELAWTNQPRAARLFHHRWNGMLRDSEHERRWHPTQKPAALAAWVYATLGDVGDVVFDPFLGSGPSLLAAAQTGRVLYGMELSCAYIAVALDRWARLTGQTPHLLETTL